MELKIQNYPQTDRQTDQQTNRHLKMKSSDGAKKIKSVDRQTDEPTDRHLLSRAPMGLKMVKIVKLVKNIIIYNHFTY